MSEFIDWRYSQPCCPSNLLSGSSLPSLPRVPLLCVRKCSVYTHTVCVGGGGGRYGVQGLRYLAKSLKMSIFLDDDFLHNSWSFHYSAVYGTMTDSHHLSCSIHLFHAQCCGVILLLRCIWYDDWIKHLSYTSPSFSCAVLWSWNAGSGAVGSWPAAIPVRAHAQTVGARRFTPAVEHPAAAASPAVTCVQVPWQR
jgi:hypothetical protein